MVLRWCIRLGEGNLSMLAVVAESPGLVETFFRGVGLGQRSGCLDVTCLPVLRLWCVLEVHQDEQVSERASRESSRPHMGKIRRRGSSQRFHVRWAG